MNINNFDDSLDSKLREAAELLNAGQRKEARQILRDALNMDRNHLATWELLLRASNSAKEEMHCVKRILAIDPNHETAKRRLKVLQSSSDRTSQRNSSRKKKRESLILLLFLGSLISLICIGVAGFAILRGGYLNTFAFPDTTATALAQKNASCQVLIDRALQASGEYCGNTDSNNACYGNSTIQADLIPDSTQRFSQQGDMVSVNELRRLTVSPLSIDGNEWGIAVFELIANLPRSLPGETISMVVFGNVNMDNTSGDSQTLESFYFTSELGQITCEQVPFDGLILQSPDGEGVRFTVNDTELTIMGTTSIKAVKNGQMEVSVYKGSTKIVSEGKEQFVGAGNKSTVSLGGENGSQAVSPPSPPKPLGEEDLALACTFTGEICDPGDIVPVSENDARTQIAGQITSTPSLTPLPSATFTASATVPATYTQFVLPTSTYTRAPTKTPGPTNTKGPTPTATNTLPSKTNTPVTPTNTNTPITPTLTFTSSPEPPTPIPPSNGICANVSVTNLKIAGTDLSMSIVNNTGAAITINEFYASWVKSSPSQSLDRLYLDGILIWNTSDPNTPTYIPSDSAWRNGVSRTIPAGGAPGLVYTLRFKESLSVGGTTFYLVFDSGCQVIGTK